MDVNESILKLTCQLYSNLHFTRSDVQSIIELFSDFIQLTYNPFILKQLQDNLHGAIDDEVSLEINKIFKRYTDPFRDHNTSDKRIRLYKNLGLFVEPETCILRTIPIPSKSGTTLNMKSKNITLTHLPMKHSLKALLETDGLLHETLSYMDFLQNEKTLLLNFVQGTLWQKQRQACTKNGIVLPLIGFFDDVELGDGLGTHAGKNEVGAVSVTIPCLPPNFASKLDSVILCSVFHTKDRKKYGNKVIFRKFLDELHHLENDGI